MGKIITLLTALIFCFQCLSADEVHNLAKQGNVEKLRAMIAAEPNLLKATDANYYDCTPLHIAAENDKTEVIRLLLDAGAEVNARDARGATPLILTGKRAPGESAALLLKAKADINITPKRQDLYPPLHAAIRNGDITYLNYLLNNGANINIRSYGDGRSALHIAASIEDGTNINPATGNWYYGGPIDPETGKPHLLPVRDIILLLLQRKANIEARNALGETPLFSAIRSNQVKNAALLLEKKANLNAIDGFGRTPIFHCSDEAGVLFLVKTMKVDVNSVDLIKGQTPLQRTSYPAVKRALIACGAKEDTPAVPPVAGQLDSQSLFRAVSAGDLVETKRLLAKNPQLIHALQSSGYGWVSWGNTPLYEAANVEVAAVLLASGANINQKNYGDFTPLHSAARSGNTAMVRFLIEKGADIEARTLDFETPLHWAAIMGKADCISALLAAKANPLALNYHLQTPLDRAREQRQPSPDAIFLLEEAIKNLAK